MIVLGNLLLGMYDTCRFVARQPDDYIPILLWSFEFVGVIIVVSTYFFHSIISMRPVTIVKYDIPICC